MNQLSIGVFLLRKWGFEMRLDERGYDQTLELGRGGARLWGRIHRHSFDLFHKVLGRIH